MANRGYGRSASVAAMRQHSIYFILPSGPSTDSTESGRVAPDAASESDRVPGALRAVAAQAPKHRLITRCGIGGDSQALYSLSIHYPLTNYLPMGMVVDNTTDVRRGKLALYESWGFPEVWVEVPEQSSPSRPAGLRPGLTIHLLESGRFRTASSSRAFPSWTAQEIHLALNEREVSYVTMAALRRVGRTLGAAVGTGPDDDPLLREERLQSRAEGRPRASEAAA